MEILYIVIYRNFYDYEERMEYWMKKKEQALILEQTMLAKDIYSIWFQTDMASEVVPGQFICVYPNNDSTLLPRPISVCEVDAINQKLRIVYRIAGAGTREFAAYNTGDYLWILGPLGNGFPLEEASGKRAMLIGGGIGIPPMVETAKQLTGETIVVAGYRDELFLDRELSANGSFYAATDSGAHGTKGTVMDAIANNHLQADIIFACGPMPMLVAIKEYAAKHQIKAYLSLEERMACGVGACLGCVCKTKEVDHHSHVHNARICTEGPVFEATEVEI